MTWPWHDGSQSTIGGAFHQHGATPKMGVVCISWKIPSRNGWFGGFPHFRKHWYHWVSTAATKRGSDDTILCRIPQHVEMVTQHRLKAYVVVAGVGKCPNVSHHPTKKGIFYIQHIWLWNGDVSPVYPQLSGHQSRPLGNSTEHHLQVWDLSLPRLTIRVETTSRTWSDNLTIWDSP